MTKELDPENGIRWARAGLGLGVLASIAGNVANVCLTPSAAHVALKIPGAVFWPTALFVGIEVMVRNRHRVTKLGYLARFLLLTVGVTTFLTSFLNLKHFLTLAGEPWLATITGPIGIDGLMLGCTVMLLAASLRTSESAPEVESVLSKYGIEQESIPEWERSLAESIADIESAPKEESARERESARGAKLPSESAKRSPRADVSEGVMEMVRSGSAPRTSTERRYKSVAKELESNPRAHIDCSAPNRKVSEAIVQQIREHYMRSAL